jgi:diguanylate cyclase (GGDEF)-like protein
VVPIETDDHVLRARRTAAFTRAILGLTGIALALDQPRLSSHPVLAMVGFATIAASATVQLTAPGLSWLKIEESLAGVAAVLIVGLGDQRVTVLSVLWLAAVASGVMARGGRVHWIGRTVVLGALALPVLRLGRIGADQAALTVATVGLLLTSGRLTRELNHLLGRARWDADHDDLTGLLSRAAFRAELEEVAGRATSSVPVSLLLIDLDGFGMVNKTVGHAAGDTLLASFGERLREAVDPASLVGRLGGDEFAVILPGADAVPFAERLLEELPRDGEDFRGISASMGAAQAPRDGGDAEALLRAGDIALRVAKRSGSGTLRVLDRPSDLSGLIIEVTEEALVQSDAQLRAAMAPLRARGARLAVDDVGAGYSGLRQLTTVHPSYLKLDRSLVSGIDRDSERAALVSALVGYAERVGSLLVAEGIENEAELLALRELGAPLAQGFYLGRPGAPWPAAAIDVPPEAPAPAHVNGSDPASLQPALG